MKIKISPVTTFMVVGTGAAALGSGNPYTIAVAALAFFAGALFTMEYNSEVEKHERAASKAASEGRTL